MGFFQAIAANYGGEAATTLKSLAKNNTKLASYRNRRIFLLECKRLSIRPRHVLQSLRCLTGLLDANPERTSGTIDRFNSRLGQKVVSLEIRIAEQQIHSLERHNKQLKSKARNLIPNHIVQEFISQQVHRYNLVFNRIKRKNLNKIRNLKNRCTDEVRVGPNWFKNLTSTTFPDNVAKMLALGPKFCVAPKNLDLDVKRLLSSVEFCISKISEAGRDLMRAQAANIITNYFQKNVNCHTVFNSLHHETKLFLKNNPDILVTRSDKGGTSVAMYTSVYEEKMLELLGDPEVYTVLKSDPTSQVQSRCNNIVKDLKMKTHIGEGMAKSLNNYKAVCPKMYGNPKIHKDDVPLRPIVSSINAPTTKLSKFMADLLKKSFSQFNKYAVKDSWGFSECVNNLSLPDGHVIVSLDVVSLFTNISLERTITVIEENWQLVAIHTSMPKASFVEIIRFLFDSNFFSFNNTIYSQKFGCPMGSNLSPVLANVVMSDLLHKSIPKLTFHLPFIFQYVDDLILSIPEDKEGEILEIFCSYDPHIKFTLEREDNRSVPFLDTRVIRGPDNVIMLDWYRKPTSSGRYINYSSYHTPKMKANVILGMKTRISRVVHPQLRNGALIRFRDLMQENGYPLPYLNKLIFSTPRQQVIGRTNSTTTSAGQDVQTVQAEMSPPVAEDLQRVYGSLPQVVNLTDKLCRLLGNSNLKIARFSLVNNGIFFTNKKDKTPLLSKSDVVYRLTCNECKLPYIGQTSTTLKQRISLHKSDSKLRPQRCSLASHVKETGHTIDYDNIKVLEVERNLFKRSFLEMCHISVSENNLNKKTDIKDLSKIYCYILSNFHKTS